MTIIEILKRKLKEIKERRDGQKELGDDVCTDRQLRGMRREIRIWNEKKEKAMLKKKLAILKQEENRRNMWGILSTAEKRQRQLDRKKYNLMQNKNYKLIRPVASQGFIRKGNL